MSPAPQPAAAHQPPLTLGSTPFPSNPCLPQGLQRPQASLCSFLDSSRPAMALPAPLWIPGQACPPHHQAFPHAVPSSVSKAPPWAPMALEFLQSVLFCRSYLHPYQGSGSPSQLCLGQLSLSPHCAGRVTDPQFRSVESLSRVQLFATP